MAGRTGRSALDAFTLAMILRAVVRPEAPPASGGEPARAVTSGSRRR